ncbi:MAG: mechanosensitive ion channel family protein [bacterium]
MRGATRSARSFAAGAMLLAAVVAAPLGVRGAASAFAQDSASVDPGTRVVRHDPLGRQTPRGTVLGFLDASRAGDYRRAAQYLDLRGLHESPASSEAEILARRLKVVLDRKLRVDLEKLSDRNAGDPDDELSADEDHIGAIATPYGSVDILLSREPAPRTSDSASASTDGAQHTIWLFAPSTVAEIPRLYAEFGYGWLDEKLPPYFFSIRFLALELWQWVGLVLCAIVAYIVAHIVARAATTITRRIVRRTEVTWDDVLLEKGVGPLRLAATVLAFYVGAQFLSLSLPAQHGLAAFCKIAGVLAMTWFLLRLVDVANGILFERLRAKDLAAASTLLPMGRRAVKIFVLTIAAISLLQNIGFNITGLVAGLGVGGLAIALAAQKTLENLFGGIAILADRPVKVGDLCTVGQHSGVVEDIGLRSTRIRTPDRTLVSIPNAEFSTARIENFSSREQIQLKTVVQLGYETSPDQMRFVLVELRKMLASHPMILAQPRRVRLAHLGAYSLDIEVFAGVETRDPEEFFAIREDIYLRIVDIVNSSGASFAFPSQTIYLARGAGRDEEKVRAAEEAVARWRKEHALFMPDLTPAAADAVARTIEYPPAGSATNPARTTRA